MQFVARNTSVPLPKVYCAFVHNRCTYVVVSEIEGTMAVRGWRERSQEPKARILTQLRQIMAELQSVSPPEGTVVRSVDGSPFYELSLPSNRL